MPDEPLLPVYIVGTVNLLVVVYMFRVVMIYRQKHLHVVPGKWSTFKAIEHMNIVNNEGSYSLVILWNVRMLFQSNSHVIFHPLSSSDI